MSKINIPIQSVEKSYLVDDFKLFEDTLQSDDYLGNPEILGNTSTRIRRNTTWYQFITYLGVPVSLTKYKSKDLDDVLEWELISKWLYSYKDSNPRKRIGSSLHAGLNDVIREVQDSNFNIFLKVKVSYKTFFF